MNNLEIKKIRKSLGKSQREFAKMLGVGDRAVQTWESGERNISNSAEILLGMIMSKGEQSVGDSNLEEPEPTYITKEKRVPYYDVDFTAGFLTVTNNQQMTPDHYVTHPFFKGCDFIVRASGQSMSKIIKHGDAIGLIEIKDWRDFLPMGEIYAIVTTNGFRMIKVVSTGEEKDSFTLISKPSDSKIDEFPAQQIKKKHILSIFKVQASSHLF